MKTNYSIWLNTHGRFSKKVRSIIHPILLFISGIILVVPGCSNPYQMVLGTPNNGRSVAVSVNPADSRHMVVASETGGLFRSKNSGELWTKVQNENNFYFTDVLHYPPNPNVIIATSAADFKTPTRAGIWRSTNEGSTWEFISLPNNCPTNFSTNALHYEASTQRLYAGTSCGIAVSADAGVTWNYLPAAPGFLGTEDVRDVTTSSANRILFSTNAQLRSTSDNGANWTVIGNFWTSFSNRSIAVSPSNEQHIYFATNAGLQFTSNNGSSWTIVSPNGVNRPSFVKVSASTATGGATKYTVYHSDGGCSLRKSEVTHSANPTFGTWTAATTQHCDYSDIGFSSDGKTPLLLTGDGGNQVTSDGGVTWTLSNKFYEAMQITEVTGQLHSENNGTADLYFGTQDNDIWASANTGSTWTSKICCEGFFLGVSRAYLPADQTKVTGVTCGACYNFIAGPLLSGSGGFPNPANANGNPILLGPGKYLMNTSIPGSDINLFQYTDNTGTSWSNKFAITQNIRDFSKVVGPIANPEVFTAIRTPGTTPSGNEILHISRVTDVLGSGTPIVSTINGFGSLGTFPTMFAWYKPFGVHPADRSQLIVSDIVSHTAKRTTDSGVTWVENTQLTNLVTAGGAIEFDKDGFTQITSYGYDPECACHILVGTREAGVMESFDYGVTWKKIAGSDKISLVSSFFFPGKNKVVISSYGTGLWKYTHKKCPKLTLKFPDLIFEEPTIKWKGGRIPISQINNPDACPVCAFVLLKGGRITNVKFSQERNAIQEVSISGGTFVSYSYKGPELVSSNELPFKVTVNPDAQFTEEEFLEELKANEKVSAYGMYLEGNLFKGVIFANTELTTSDLPKVSEPKPTLSLIDSQYGYFSSDQESITIRATNFNANAALQIMLNGTALSQNQYSIESEGENLVITLNVSNLDIGAYTLYVNQKNGQELLADVLSFNIAVAEQFKR